jgi:hypothetical protein
MTFAQVTLSSSLFAVLIKCLSGDPIEEVEMSRAYGTCGRRRMHTEFWWGNLKGRTHLEGLVIDR